MLTLSGPMTPHTKRLVIGYSALRAVYAVGLLVAPGRFARPWLGDVHNASASIPTRGLGARELTLGRRRGRGGAVRHAGGPLVDRVRCVGRHRCRGDPGRGRT